MGLMTSMMAIIPSLRRLTSVQTSISRGVSAAERLFGILDMPVERDDGQHRVQRTGELAFDHVMRATAKTVASPWTTSVSSPGRAR